MQLAFFVPAKNKTANCNCASLQNHSQQNSFSKNCAIYFFHESMHSVVNEQFSIKASGDGGVNGKCHSYDLSNSSSYLVIVDLNSNMPPLILTVNTS